MDDIYHIKVLETRIRDYHYKMIEQCKFYPTLRCMNTLSKQGIFFLYQCLPYDMKIRSCGMIANEKTIQPISNLKVCIKTKMSSDSPYFHRHRPVFTHHYENCHSYVCTLHISYYIPFLKNSCQKVRQKLKFASTPTNIASLCTGRSFKITIPFFLEPSK